MRSDRTVYLGVLGPLVLAIALLAGLSVAGLQVLSAVRAYAGGESLWSKARNDAVDHLRAYALTGQAPYRERFIAALAVNLGDRQARETLDQPAPDLQQARDGFLRGANSPDDIDGMIRLYRWFRGVRFMQEALAAWAEGDRLIAALQALGERVHAQVQAGADATAMAPLLQELEALDFGLGEAGNRFADTLGHASRAATSLLIATIATLAALLAAGAALFVQRSLRQHLDDGRLLREANERWALAADADGLGVVDWDIAGDRFRLDPRAAALFGIDAARTGTVSRADLRVHVHPDDLPTNRLALDAALDNGGRLQRRFRIVGRDGALRHLEITALLHDDGAARRARMVGIVRDVTAEVDRAQLQLDKESAERAARARMAFLSRLSHELRTPLNAILGMSQLLLIDSAEPLTAQQRRRVQIVHDSGRHQLRLVEEVLDITRIDAAALDVRSEPADVLAALRDSLGIVEPERAAFDITVDASALPDVLPPVQADPQRLRQVFVNLLSNACKYNRRGGTLRLACTLRPPQLQVQVRDEGRGLGADEVAALFQPFERLFAPADVSSTGLGLVVVKMLVEQMHGSIEVDSRPGAGSTFTVGLPLA